MVLVMMEAGEQVIVVERCSGCYFFVDALIWKNFHAPDVIAEDWLEGCRFALPDAGESFTDNRTEPAQHPVVAETIQYQDLIAQFTDLERNSGAMIAVRELEAESPRVIDKRRYKKLKLCFDS